MKNLLNKTLEKSSLIQLMRHLENHFDEYQFFNSKTRTFGFNGEMLKTHIEREWRLTNLFHCDEPVFIGQNSVENESETIFSMVGQLPFSFIRVKQVLDEKQTLKTKLEDFSQYFFLNSYTSMEKCTFCYPSQSMAFFHKQQRERKIWWRKFASLPGRFAMTEISEISGNTSVEVTADFPWGMHTVESVRCLTEPMAMQVKDGRKTVSPHMIVSECKLEPASLVYMCDAFDPLNEETNRNLMRFHRKLSPYKVTFAATASTANISKELTDLALVLARKIRKVGIPCLLLPDVVKKSLESTFLRADYMGIPYTLVLNDRTLTDGILGLRSRDTTLKEQSHVGVIVSYVEQLMKNY